MKNLLVEYFPFEVKPELVLESTKRNNGRLIVSGVLQRANVKNQNHRIYPRPILEREVNRYAENEITQKRALGELDHAEDVIVNLRNVSHNILEVWWDGDDLLGKVEILNTPSGNIVKELMLAGISVGISSRGLGSVKTLHEGDEQTVEVQPDFELVCWDFVSNASTHGAYLKPNTVSESVQPVLENYDKAHGLIRDIICELSGVCCL